MLDLALPAKIAVLLRDATQAGNEEGRLFSQAITVRRKKNSTCARLSTVSPTCRLVYIWHSLNERFYVLKWLLDQPRLQARLPPFPRKKDRGEKAGLEPYLSLKSCQDIFYVAYP